MFLQKITDFKDNLTARGLLQRNFKTPGDGRSLTALGASPSAWSPSLKKCFSYTSLSICSCCCLFSHFISDQVETPAGDPSSRCICWSGRKGEEPSVQQEQMDSGQSRATASPRAWLSRLCKPADAESLCRLRPTPAGKATAAGAPGPPRALRTAAPGSASLGLGLVLGTSGAVPPAAGFVTQSWGGFSPAGPSEPTSLQPRGLLVSALRKTSQCWENNSFLRGQCAFLFHLFLRFPL